MRTLIAAGRNSLLGLAVAIVVVSACSDDDGGGDSGGAAGRGGAGSSGTAGDASTGGKGGSKATGGTSGSKATGGTSGSTAGVSGEAGAAGSTDGGRGPVGGAGGSTAGGEGGGFDREATPEEICKLYCPPGDSGPLDAVRHLCGEPDGQGGAGGAAPYDQAACYRECLVEPDVNVARPCRDEAMIFAKCRMDIENWLCVDTGGGYLFGCGPAHDQLRSCQEPTPDEICALSCPPGDSNTFYEVRGYCGEADGSDVPEYDQATCYRDCIDNGEFDVPRPCRGEAMLYAKCRMDIENWKCLEPRPGYALWGCDPVSEQLSYCIALNQRF